MNMKLIKKVQRVIKKISNIIIPKSSSGLIKRMKKNLFHLRDLGDINN